MRGSACAVLAGLLGVGVGACANVWGFAELTSENRDAASDSGLGDGTLPSGDAADASDAGTTGCNLASDSVCTGKCARDASPCGCLADPVSLTTHCGVAGNGSQGTNCSSDYDCKPGYGCLMTMPQPTCAHWCRPTTTCPAGTTCQNNPTATYNINQVFKYCY
jgi:hypothetical protein